MWLGGFKTRLREGLTAQVRAIVAREGMSAMSGIVSLAIVFATITVVAVQHVGQTALLVGLATTLPRQIEMTYELHLLASGWNDFIAIWTRFGGVASQHAAATGSGFRQAHQIRPAGVAGGRRRQRRFVGRRRVADRARASDRPHQCARRQRRRQIVIAGKPEDRDEKAAYYWPTSDRLAFKFTGGVVPVDVEGDDEDEVVVVAESMDKKLGFSSGERQLKSLEEIVNATRAKVYLLDEWDANLDAANKAKADALVDELAARARVVEISHRDRAA